jgi:hypothetical protein
MASVPDPRLYWLLLVDGSSISSSSFPIKLNAQLTDLLATKKVEFFQRKKDTGQVNLIGAVLGPSAENISLDWSQIYENGEYELFAEIVTPGGERFQSATINVIIQ